MYCINDSLFQIKASIFVQAEALWNATEIFWPKKLAVSDVSRSIQSHVGFSCLIPPSSHYNGVLLFTALKMRRSVQEKWQVYSLLRVNHAIQCCHVFYKYIIIISEDHLQCFAHLQMLLNRFNHVETFCQNQGCGCNYLW